MDKIVIDKKIEFDNMVIDKDSRVVFNEDVQADNFELNIIDCKVKIIDKSMIKNKIININNSTATIVEVVSESLNKSCSINNVDSNIEYNVIDMLDVDVNYKINGQINRRGSKNIINVASVSYKGKNKDYQINTSNVEGDSISEINCFGIVKDNSLLNYDVRSFIKKGAKKSTVRQNSNILLFDKESVGKNNPVLLIEENDVKASHGSSIGKIDDDTMFYLCSRGLSKNEATNLICLGKVENLINKIEDEEVKISLINKFKERMI